VPVSNGPLPSFRYYQAPIEDGTIEESGDKCARCGRERGFIVKSLLYSATLPDDARFCPWCVADGSAAAEFDGTFNQVAPGASAEAADVVRRRTPGFLSWQDVDWPTHCGDVGVYLGQPSGDELRQNRQALDALMAEVTQYDWAQDEEYMRDFIDGLGGSQVVYLFECPTCGTQLIRWDLD
jgi:uncharacterized protein CbrC (UPF0167 family)